jgi:autotransporter-associated beta strand protein
LLHTQPTPCFKRIRALNFRNQPVRHGFCSDWQPNRNPATIIMNTHRKLLRPAGLLPLFLLAGLLDCVQTASAASQISWANPATVSQSSISSTNGQALIYVPSNPYAVGDVIYFNGTTVANNPFGTTANRYFVIFSSGNNIKVATTYNGTAANAANSITAAATAQQCPDWLTGGNWTGGVAPNNSSTLAGFPGAGGGANPPGAIIINGAVTTYGLGWINLSQDLAIYSGSSGSALNALTFATADSTTPKITCTNASGGVIFLGNSTQAGSLKINGTQGLIFNAGPGGAITGGSGVTAVSTFPAKDIRVYNTVDWSGFSGGIQIERGVVSQQNGTSTLGVNQSLTVGNNQTLANNLLAGFNLNGRDCTIGAFNGTSLGRIYCNTAQSIFTVDNDNSSGSFSGDIGYNFDGTIPVGNVWLHKAGTGTQTISGLIAGTNTTVTVDGGTLILSGTNIYMGATTIATGGKLIGVVGGSCSNSAVTINNTAGCVLGVLVNNNTLQWSCTNLTSAGTSAGLEFAFAVAPSATVAPLNILNNLTFTGIPSITLDPANLSAGTYPLIKVGGTAPTASVPTVTIANGGRGLSAVASWSGNTLQVTISGTSTEPLTWNSSGTGTWDINNSGNTIWKDAASAATYYRESMIGDSVQFTDTGLSADTTVTLNTSVSPISMSVNNSTYNYTISGSGAIAGAVGLTKSGSQTLTISNANTFSGNFSLNAGTVRVGNAAALGTGSATIGASGTLDLNGQTIANAITTVNGGALLTNSSASAATVSTAIGSSSVSQVGNFTVGASGNIAFSDVFAANTVTLTKAGAGTLTLGGANNNLISGNPLGGVTVNAGVVVLAKTGSATAADGATVNAGGTLQMDPTHTTTGWQSWAGQLNGGVALAGGTLDLNGVSGKNNLVRSVQGTGLVTNSSTTPAELQITTRDSATVAYSGTIVDGPGAGKVSVTFSTSGTTSSGRINVFSGTNTYSGDTTINFATLELGSAYAVQNSTVNLAATGGLGANASPLEFTNGITAFTIGD